MQVDSAVEEIVFEETKCTPMRIVDCHEDNKNKQTAVIVYSCENKCVPTVWRAFTGCRKTNNWLNSTFMKGKSSYKKNSGCEKFSPLTFFVPFFVFVTAKQNSKLYLYLFRAFHMSLICKPEWKCSDLSCPVTHTSIEFPKNLSNYKATRFF